MKDISHFSIGQTASFEITLDQKLVKNFATLSGDKNPLHSDRKLAIKWGFEKEVVYGMIAAPLFSQLIGSHLPGTGALYLSQSLFFHQPMYGGMTIIVQGKILHISKMLKTLKIETQIFAQSKNIPLVTGEAMIKLLA